MGALDLVIRNPHASGERDFILEAPDSITVRQLKTRLRDEYPTKPSEAGQTLIHSGRILKDDSKLRDAISKVCSPPTPVLPQPCHQTFTRPERPRFALQLQYHEEGPKIFHLIVKGQHLLSRTKSQIPAAKSKAAAQPALNDAGSALARQSTAPALMQSTATPAATAAQVATALPHGGHASAEAEAAANMAFAEAEAQYAALREAANAQADFLAQCVSAPTHALDTNRFACIRSEEYCVVQATKCVCAVLPGLRCPLFAAERGVALGTGDVGPVRKSAAAGRGCVPGVPRAVPGVSGLGPDGVSAATLAWVCTDAVSCFAPAGICAAAAVSARALPAVTGAVSNVATAAVHGGRGGGGSDATVRWHGHAIAIAPAVPADDGTTPLAVDPWLQSGCCWQHGRATAAGWRVIRFWRYAGALLARGRRTDGGKCSHRCCARRRESSRATRCRHATCVYRVGYRVWG